MTIIVEEEDDLKTFTDTHYAQASFCWQYLIKNREIKVNGVKVSGDMRLQKGDTVSYFLTPKQREKIAFYTVFEDDNVCVVDKESGVNAEAVFAELSRGGEYYFLHRLDRNTKGLMAFAKTVRAEKALLDAFKDRRVEKTYRVACFGAPKKDKDILTAYLKKDEKTATVSLLDSPASGYEKIVTEYEKREELIVQGERVSLLEVRLHTGKTHQIRAHLRHIGCPVVGDTKYGDKEKNKKLKVERQRLVAKRLRFLTDGELGYLQDKVFFSRFDEKDGFLEKE